MTFKMFISFVFAALCQTDVCYGYSSPKYTWPLHSANALLEIKNGIAEGTTGCLVSSGEVNPTLQYSGIQVTGSSNSYVDIVIDDSNEFSDDYSFTIFSAAKDAKGGNIFHYKQDDSAVDPYVEKIKDVILWYNQTHLIAETQGPNDESYGSVVIPINSADYVNEWIGFGVRYDRSGEKLRLLIDPGVETEIDTLNDANIGQPGAIRIGGSFDTFRSHFNGDLICVNMFDSKISSDDLSESLNECDLGNWDQNALGGPVPALLVLFKQTIEDQQRSRLTDNIFIYQTGTGGGSAETCEGFRGYYVIKQRDVALESITALNTMTTSSHVRCADFCMSKELCWTFTINKAEGICKLFDADYSSKTVFSTGTHYYIRR